MAVKMWIENLTKIFGKSPRSVLSRVNSGASKEEVIEDTGHTVAINNASFEVNEGEIFAIMGLTGSGKSTLLRCLNLLSFPTEGKIYVDGENIVGFDKDKLREFKQNKISMVFKEFGIFNHRTVIENVECGLELSKFDKSKRYEIAKKALASVGLGGWSDKYPDELSGGMQQRVELARALVNNPDILLMNQPFSELESSIRGEMQLELLDIQSKLKKTIIFVAHDINEALKLGDRIAIMKDGVIVQIGTPQEILEHPVNDYVEQFTKDIDKSKILNAENIMIKPHSLVTIEDKPENIINRMKINGIYNTFVIDDNKKIRGIITKEDVIKAIKEHKNIKEILRNDYHTVTPDMYIQKLLGITINAKYPIAVINEENTLLGSIGAESIISALA